MRSSWRSKCFLNGPAKHIHSLIYGGWFYVEPARPFLEGHCFIVERKHYHVAMPARQNRRCRKSFLNRPARCKSAAHCPFRYSYPFSPVFQAHSLTVEGEETGLSSVICLLLSRTPLAVGWLVIAVAIYPIQRVGWTGFRSHVFQESYKRLTPSFANSYAPTSVSMIPTGAGAVTSRFHHLPRVIFKAFACAVSASFRSHARWNRIARSHLKLLQSFMVVRAESVHHDRLGSFYCSMLHKAVQ